MQIVFFETEPWMREYITPLLPSHDLVFTEEALTPQTVETYSQAEIISVFVFSKVSEAVLSQMPKLVMIAARSTGYDHIDIEAATKQNVLVTNVPQYGSITVAEHTWALILALSRRIFESYDRTEAYNFSTSGLRGFDLNQKTLGLIGLGAIGTHVALMSKGFSMKLRVYARTQDLAFAHQFENFTYVDKVEDIYTHADVLSFHVPLTKETHHMLNMDNYSLLKPGSIVINTSRGALLQTEALVLALNQKIIRGAGLDVLESEQLMQHNNSTIIPPEQELAETYLNHLLIGMDNVLLTPHNAFNSDESIRRLVNGNIDCIHSFMKNAHDCINQVLT